MRETLDNNITNSQDIKEKQDFSENQYYKMATRFVRVDLAEDAVDFRPIAIEPGVPLLDTAGANDKIMFKWLGSLIAEPEWQEDGHSVNFYVRDEQGGRLEEATVQLVEECDLEGPLAGQVEQIRERLNAAKAYSSAEDMMLRLQKPRSAHRFTVLQSSTNSSLIQ